MPSLPRARIGLLIVGLGIIAAPLDTAVNIAFPSITQAFDLQVQDIRWVVIAVLISTGVGLVFGVYPAYKASKLNPIEALRFET